MGIGETHVGELIRRWRTDVGLTQADTRHRLAELATEAQLPRVSPTLLSYWENGHRRPSSEHLRLLDRCFDADGALVDMCRALGTPLGIAPRTHWAFNVIGPIHSVWAWIRPVNPGRVDALLKWGAFKAEVSSPCDGEGVVVAAPITVPGSTASVQLAQAGWVDAGDGAIPASLGIPIVDVVPLTSVAESADRTDGLLDPILVEHMTTNERFADAVADFFAHPNRLVVEAARRANDPIRIPDVRPPRPFTMAPLRFTGPEFRRLREARGYSRAEAAQAISEMLPTQRVSVDQLDVFERGGSPRPQRIASRLDVLLHGDGYTCSETATVVRRGGRTLVEYPPYWLGPIWLSFQAPANTPPVGIRLHWGAAQKMLRAHPGGVVRFRRLRLDPNPLRVTEPLGWTVTAGIGMRPEAVNISEDWSTDRPARMNQDHDAADQSLLAWFGKTPEEFEKFCVDELGPDWRDG